MKKCIKFIAYLIMLIVVPSTLVFMIAFCLRSYLDKPLFYNKKSNYNCNQLVNGYSDSKIRYAKVKANCYLFKTTDVTDASYRNVEYIVPESYFVVILSDVNSFIKKVQYNNKIGYVSADSIKEVEFLPVNPFLENITFDVDNNVGTQLRKTPVAEDNSNIITVIPAGSQSISYIASTVGTIPTGGSSNIWYYAIYSPASDPTSVYEGYVYSAKTTNLSDIQMNEEDVEDILQNSKSEYSNFVLDDTIKTVLIVLICIPIVLVFVLLVVNNKRNLKLQKQVNEKYSELKTENSNKNLESSSYKKIIDKKLSKIDDLNGKQLTRKEPFYTKYVSEDNSDSKNSSQIFPTYEMVDDDDLL